MRSVVRSRSVVGFGICILAAIATPIPVAGLSWATDAVRVTQGSELSGYVSPQASLPACTLQWVKVVGYETLKALCVERAKDFSIAISTSVSPVLDNGPYISIGDGPYALLRANSEGNFPFFGYYVSPERNDLTVIVVIGEAAYIKVYANAHQVLRSVPGVTGNGTLAMQYILPGEATYVLEGPDRQNIWVRYGGLSSNGRYFVAQAYTDTEDNALLRLDMDTFAIRVFSNASHGTTWNDYNYRIGVAGSGQTVVFANKTGNAVLYDLSGSCGIDAIRHLSSEEVCPSVQLTPQMRAGLGLSENAGIDGSKFTAPMFASDYRLRLGYLANSQGKPVQLDITHKRSGEFGLDYLALGDSYSSGEGDVEKHPSGDTYYFGGTEEAGMCHMSERAYPFLLRDKWSIASDRMRSVACSGATVKNDMNGDMDTYIGQHKELEGALPAEKRQRRIYAIEDFAPGVVPQIEFVREHQPKFVTLTGGGNDVGFADVLLYCASSFGVDFTCDYANEGTHLQKSLYEKIDTQYDLNKALIEAIKSASPDTRIAIVGYPSFIKPRDSACWWSDASLDGKEKAMIDDAVIRMNNVLIRVAYDTQVSYVDTYGTLIGGRICEGEKYVTGVMNLGVGKLAKQKVDESFHPNAAGHARLAQRIYDSNVYNHDLVPVKSLFARMIEAVQTYSYEIIQRGVAYIAESIRVHFPRYTFLPKSSAVLMAYSAPVELGTFTANSDGSLDMEFLASKLSPGLHVLVLEGTDYRGNPIRYMQHIEVRVSKDDADGDGIKDIDDPCTFVSSLHNPETGEYICRRQTTSGGGTRSNANKGMPKDDDDRQKEYSVQSEDAQIIASDKLLDMPLNGTYESIRSMLKENGCLRSALLIIITGGLISGTIYYIYKQRKR